jgi:hypothetical protein
MFNVIFSYVHLFRRRGRADVQVHLYSSARHVRFSCLIRRY